MEVTAEREYRGKKIRVQVQSVGRDVAVTLTGGDLPHAGAVSLCRKGENPETLTFPEHREQILTERWAQVLAEHLDTTVTVIGGIHYDRASREEIREIMNLTEELLQKVKETFA